MLIAQVVGTVVASRKEPLMEGFKLMAVQPVDGARRPTGPPLVAVDSVGAGPGELVLLVAGSSARYTAVTSGKPADLTILAIIDRVDIDSAAVEPRPGAGHPDPGVSSVKPRKGGPGV